MANAFRLAGCPRSTLRDFIAIAELRIVDEREFESASREISVGSVKDLETVCRGRLRRHLPAMATCDERDSYCRSNSMIDFTIKDVSPNTQTAPLGATNKNKVITT